MQKNLLITAGILAFVYPFQVSATEIDISEAFGRAVLPDTQAGTRAASPETTLASLQRSQIVSASTKDRFDYSDYYKVLRPTRFLGAQVHVVREESARVGARGCCVNPGIELILEANRHSMTLLKRFSLKNGCKLTSNYDAGREINFVSFFSELPSRKLVSLSCTEMTLSDHIDDLSGRYR